MEDDVVFADKMDECGFRVLPIGFPVFASIGGPLPGGGDIADRRVHPDV